MRTIRAALLLVTSLGGWTSALRSQGADLTVEGIFLRRAWVGDAATYQWLPDGVSFGVLEPTAQGATDLYRVDAVTGERQLLVRGADLVPSGGAGGGAERTPIGIEEFTFSRDRSRLLLFTNSQRVWRRNTKGTYYVWDLDARKLMPVSTRPGYQMFAKFSPTAEWWASCGTTMSS